VEYAVSGVYTAVFNSAAGCDSVATLNLLVVPVLTSSLDTVVCENETPVVWNGVEYAVSGVYSVVFNSAAGCDSVATLNLTIVPETTSITDTTIYKSDLPFIWNGNSYNTEGTYNNTLVNANGCDSLLILNLTVLTPIPPTVTIDTAVCVQVLPVVWNGKDYYSEGQYRDTLISISGADSTVILNLTHISEIKPTFAQFGPYCQNVNAEPLPTVSLNNIKGTWRPATINTQIAWIGTYKFTPDSGQCSQAIEIEIEILPVVKPTFTSIGPLCQNTLPPALPLVSTNGITGTWNPMVIDTKVEGLFTYTFTPLAGQCTFPVSMVIEITPEITPEFAQLSPMCQNSAAPILPAVSMNGITGTWSPAIINTKDEGTFTFTFTPAPVFCSKPVNMNIVITEEIIPVFEAFDPICPFSVAPLLPAVSTNGITGTWNPEVINTDVQGKLSYTFIPDSGQCATKVTIDIEISDIIPPVAISRNITVYLDADGKASITTAQINHDSYDNCKLDTLYLSRYDFDCDDVGKNPVTLTAIDVVGLVGTNDATVTVLDTISPVVICRGPFEIQLDENAEYKLTVAEVLESVDDNCKKIDTMYVYPHELDCEHIGLTSIILMVKDMNGNSSYCQTEVMVYGNRPPSVIDDSATTTQNLPVAIDVIDNDFDEKTSINISSLAVNFKPHNGTVAVNPFNGDITYTPNWNFTGIDVFEYKICDDGIPCDPECGKALVYIVVRAINVAPVAVDDYYEAGCFSVAGNVLDNDRDPDSDNYQINTNPLVPTNHGKLIIDPDGTIAYFPNDGFVGIDSFQYEIYDAGIPVLYDSAWVYINVDCSQESLNLADCELFIPEGFSPNEDGIHDFFRIMCIHNYPNAKLMIFNRNGDLLWQKQNYGNYDVWGDQYNAWWWGTSVLSKYDIEIQTINGDPKLKVGNYVYVLQLGNGEVKNGTVMISY
jgi:gliding motility-associated-like protein